MKKAPLLESTNLEEIIIDALTIYAKAESCNNEIISEINTFRDDFNIEQLRTKITITQTNLDTLNWKKARLEQNQQCIEYSKLVNGIQGLKDKSSLLSEELEDSQSHYINKYFDEINTIFKKLGSEDFELAKAIDTKGNKKVYSLSVKFKNYKITNDQLQYVFSESDRRALALSIFWTKLNISTDKSNRIIVMDDPVTSFDDNRITKSINLFKEGLTDFGQIIILTHYPNLIRRFLEITKDSQITFKIFQIQKSLDSCCMFSVDRKDFILNKIEMLFLNIYDFINRKCDIDIRHKLRPYLENYLKMIYNKQIYDFNLESCNLNELIEALLENVIIDDVQATELHKYRNMFNADSHIMTTNNLEDVRGLASEMITYLHSFTFSST